MSTLRLPDYTTIHATDVEAPGPTSSREAPLCDQHDGHMHRRREGLPSLVQGWLQVCSNADTVNCAVCCAVLAARREERGERIAVALVCVLAAGTALAPVVYRAVTL